MTAEWRHVTQRFHHFIANLRPTPGQRHAAQAAVADVASTLHERFTRLGDVPTAVDHMVIGGYAKGTAIRPGRGIDMLYVLPPEARPVSGCRAADQPPLSERMATALERRFASVEQAREGWVAVLDVCATPGEETAVRVIPGFRCPGGGFLVARPAAGVAWRYTDPAAEITHLRKANQASADKATHLILMLKAWRRARRVPISALTLELLVCEFVSVWTYHRRSLLFYDWMVRDFFFWLGHQDNRVLSIPGSDEALQAGDAWLPEARAAYVRAQHACRLERDNRNEAAVRRWHQIFGPAFDETPGPLPDEARRWLALPGTRTSGPNRREPV